VVATQPTSSSLASISPDSGGGGLPQGGCPCHNPGEGGPLTPRGGCFDLGPSWWPVPLAGIFHSMTKRGELWLHMYTLALG
jgi:hypothetical protein